jgi:hypothetical protein
LMSKISAFVICDWVELYLGFGLKISQENQV